MTTEANPAETVTLDPVVEFYKQGVDRTLIRENLRRSPEERLRALQQLLQFAEDVRAAGIAIRKSDP